MNSFNEFASSSCCVAPSSNLTVAEKKNLIINNYLPNLSSYQKIIFTDNEKKIKRICPDVNFEKNKKNYFLFYNNNLVELKEYYIEKLKERINSHPYSINLYKTNLLSAIESDNFNINDEKGIKQRNFMDKFFSFFLNDKIYKEVEILGYNLSLINHIIKEYGKNINNKKFAFITVLEDLSEKISVNYFPPEKDVINEFNGSNYLIIEKELNELANSNETDDNFIKKLDICLEKFKNEIKPRVSLDNRIEFCFALNRISSYLNNMERLLGDKDLELLEKMSKLRRKIDLALLEFRFLHNETDSLILNIKIDRFKPLFNTNNLKSIFLEKEESKKFIYNLEESLRIKASNLKKEKAFDILSFNEIKELAYSIDISSFDEINEKLETEVNELKDKTKQMKGDLYFSFIKLGLKIVDDANPNKNVLKLLKDGKEITLNSSGINNFLHAEKEIQKNKNEENNENNKEVDEISKNNFNTLGIENDNVTNEYLKELTNGFQNYLEMQKIERTIESIENKKKKLETKQNYDVEFICTLKLYNQLVRKNLQSRDDYFGIIIEEKKIITELKKNNNNVLEEIKNLREYVIYEFNKDINESIDFDYYN